MIRNRRAATLVELLIAIAVLGVIGAMTALSADPKKEPVVTPVQVLENARRDAVRTGRPIHLRVSIAERSFALSAFPDGSILADSALAATVNIGTHDEK